MKLLINWHPLVESTKKEFYIWVFFEIMKEIVMKAVLSYIKKLKDSTISNTKVTFLLKKVL